MTKLREHEAEVAESSQRQETGRQGHRRPEPQRR